MQGDGNSYSTTAKIAFGALGTLVLGAIGSGIWEILFRPGISRFGNLLTSISARADQAAYQTAALDPTPVSSLVILLLFLQIPMLLAMWFIFFGFVQPALERKLRSRFRRIEEAAANHSDKEDLVERSILSDIRKLSILGAAIGVLMFMASFYVFSIENKAVVIWRVFHQNLDICRQYLPQDQEERVLAAFRSIDGKADFDRIKIQLDQVASDNGRELNWRDAR